MPGRQISRCSLPNLWLVTDRRTDGLLAAALARLPRGAGVIFRHYHLGPGERRARFRGVQALARRRGLVLAWAGGAREARGLGADACYGSAALLARGPTLARLVTAHSLAELGAAARGRADAVLLSPVFATRSHPGARGLGPVRFRLLAWRGGVPVLALGGMNAHRARALGATGWAAIDGLADAGNSIHRNKEARIPVDS